MSEEEKLDVRTPEARSEVYGRLAQAFAYPEPGKQSLLSAVDYTEAFDPAASKTACSVREYNYNKEMHSTNLNEELLRFYHFFGLSRAPDALMPDHISIELEFMQFLCTLEANAAERGDDVLPIRKAQRDFIQRHVRRLVHGIAESFRADSEACLALVEMTVEVINADLHQLVEELGLGSDQAA